MPVYTVTPTISTGAYSDGDVIGGANKIADVDGGLLVSICVYDDDAEGVQLDFFFFKAALVGTYTDNAAFAINASDKPNWIGVASVAAADYFAAGSGASVGTSTPKNVVIPQGALYYVSVIRSATTYTATTDLTYLFGIV